MRTEEASSGKMLGELLLLVMGCAPGNIGGEVHLRVMQDFISLI